MAANVLLAQQPFAKPPVFGRIGETTHHQAMNKLNDKILHINCDKPLSKETIKLINRMVEIASNMSEDELKKFNDNDQCKIKCHHKWMLLNNETDQCIHCGKII